MRRPRRSLILDLTALGLLALPLAAASEMPMSPADRLPPCPRTPNCVSSLSADERHAIAPLPLIGAPETAVERLARLVSSMPGGRVDSSDDLYLHATFRSRVFRFVDDLELLVDPRANVVHVRSASRVGGFDFGANRRRVEALRGLLQRERP